jgi:NAD(P)-dependent dehydrogenase (short-subunit alcohol dehydrogenase family)
MDLKLEDKVVIVTGASAGIGEATVALLVEEGALVVASARNLESLAIHGDRVAAVPGDLTHADTVGAVVDAATERFGRIDGLVNNLGAVKMRSSFLDITDADWVWAFEVNLMTMVRMTRAVIPVMLAGGGGSLVHMTSEAARLPAPALVDYAATKTSMLTVSKCLVAEFGPQGIRSNVVAPGPTWSRLWEAPGAVADQLAEQLGLPREEAIDHFIKNVRNLPSQKLGEPRDVARAVAFLLSPDSSQINGAEYAVDGGALGQI